MKMRGKRRADRGKTQPTGRPLVERVLKNSGEEATRGKRGNQNNVRRQTAFTKGGVNLSPESHRKVPESRERKQGSGGPVGQIEEIPEEVKGRKGRRTRPGLRLRSEFKAKER